MPSIYWFRGSSKYDVTLGDEKLPRSGLYRALPFPEWVKWLWKLPRYITVKAWWTKVNAHINIIKIMYSSWIPNSSGHQYDVCFLTEWSFHRFLTKSWRCCPRLRWANLWWSPTLGNLKIPLKLVTVKKTMRQEGEQLKLPVHRLQSRDLSP